MDVVSTAAPVGTVILGCMVLLLAIMIPAIIVALQTQTQVIILSATLPKVPEMEPQPSRVKVGPLVGLRRPARAEISNGGVGAADKGSPWQRDFALVPMTYSEKDMGLVMKIQIGNSNSIVVFDTGSSKVAVATTECAADNLCSAKDASYNPRESPTARPTFEHKTLHFATLSIDAEIVRDAFGLAAVRPDIAERRHWVNPKIGRDEALVPVHESFPIYAAHKMQGTKSNVFGFMKSGDTYRKCIDAIGAANRWILACKTVGNAWMCLGNPPPQGFIGKLVSKCIYAPMSRTMSHEGAYIVDVEEFHGGKGKDAPRHVVIDTGTADSYFLNMGDIGLPKTNQVIGPLKWQYLPTLTIKLQGGPKIVLKPSRYTELSGLGGRITNLHPSSNVIENVFATKAPILLLGIAHIRGMTIDFDVENNRVGFAQC